MASKINPQWLRLLPFIGSGSVVVYSLFMGFFCVRSLFCYAYFMSFLVLQSSRWGRESWLLYFYCLLVVSVL